MSEPLFAARQRDALIEACLRHPVLDVRYYPGDDVIYATTNDGDEVVEGVNDHTEQDDETEHSALRRVVAHAATRLSVRALLRRGVQRGQ